MENENGEKISMNRKHFVSNFKQFKCVVRLKTYILGAKYYDSH